MPSPVPVSCSEAQSLAEGPWLSTCLKSEGLPSGFRHKSLLCSSRKVHSSAMTRHQSGLQSFAKHVRSIKGQTMDVCLVQSSFVCYHMQSQVYQQLQDCLIFAHGTSLVIWSTYDVKRAAGGVGCKKTSRLLLRDVPSARTKCRAQSLHHL